MRMVGLTAINFCVLISLTGAVWYEGMLSSESFKFGKSMVLKIEDAKVENVSYIDRLALRVDYGNVGVVASKNFDTGRMNVDYYLKESEEGRGKKIGSMMIPFILGGMKGGIFGFAMGTLKGIALKALLLSNLALLATLVILSIKFFKQHEKPYVEIEDVGYHPVTYQLTGYGNYGYANNGDYMSNGYSASASAYSGYVPDETQLNYVGMSPPNPVDNDTLSGLMAANNQHQVIPAMKRLDNIRKKRVNQNPTIVTIKRIAKGDV